jgi:transcriptional regulator
MTTLTDADVRAIRADPRTQAEIARTHNTSQATVSRIKHGKVWGHVASSGPAGQEQLGR